MAQCHNLTITSMRALETQLRGSTLIGFRQGRNVDVVAVFQWKHQNLSLLSLWVSMVSYPLRVSQHRQFVNSRREGEAEEAFINRLRPPTSGLQGRAVC